MYRLIGMLMTVGVMGGGLKAGQDTMSGMLDWVKIVLQQRELTVIRDAAIMVYVETSRFPFPGDVFPNEAFNRFLRDRITARARDPARDFWGNHYFIALSRWGERVLDAGDFALQSAGPDGRFRTLDDVYCLTFY